MKLLRYLYLPAVVWWVATATAQQSSPDVSDRPNPPAQGTVVPMQSESATGEELIQCTVVKDRANQNAILSDDELKFLKDCSFAIPICVDGSNCVVMVPKDLTREGIGGEWMTLFPGVESRV